MAGISPKSRGQVFVLSVGLVVGLLVAGLLVPYAFGERAEGPGGGGAVAAGPEVEPVTTPPTSAAIASEAPGEVTGRVSPSTPSAGGRTRGIAPVGGGGGGGAGGTPREAVTGTRRASDVGVRADRILLGIFLLDVGSLGAVGISVPGVDPEGQREQWNVFIKEANDAGGILGRRVEAYYRNYDVFRQDDQRAACLDVADKKPFATLDIGGIFGPAVLCISDENKLPFLTLASQGIPRDFFPRSQGRLFSLFQSGVRSMANLAWEMHQMGRLKGQTIGIVGDEETDPGGGTVDTGMIDTLRQLGYQVAHRTTLSADRGTASSQIPVEVSQMQTKNVSVVFLLTGNLYATQFVQNADSRQYKPKYYASDWGSAYSDTWVQNMPQSFEGSLVITASRNGEWRQNRPEPELDRGCRERFERSTNKKLDRSGLPYNTTLRICALFSIFAEGATRSGIDLTRPGYSNGIQSLGRIGLATFGGGSFRTGKFDAADFVRALTFQFACRCWMPVDEFRPTRF